VLAYHGADFHGWQVQPELRTVQGVLEKTLSEVLGEEVEVAGAGRTDAGVHARGQTASFHSLTSLPARALTPLLNRALPADVRIRSAREVDGEFHARHSAVARRYGYRLLDDDDLLLSGVAWWPREPIDAGTLERATRALEGEHDFSAFRGAGSSSTSPRCRLMRASWTREGPMLRFDVVADHFIYHMVRNIVGTALAASRRADPGATMREVLVSRDRRRAGVTAPARGLCLEQVFYEEERA
jgi:tRNA pseudouridine38-40 synthase